MSDDGPSGRPKRRAAKRSTVPSAVHYVGYVEDDETPEMIMKKFEELEKVRAAVATPAKPATESPEEVELPPPEADEGATAGREIEAPEGVLAGLTDAQLLEVFKQTSIFNVRSALAGNEALLDGEHPEDGMDRWSDEDASDDEGLWSDVRGFWSDDEDAATAGHWRKGRAGKGRREPRIRGATHSKPRHDIVTHYNAATQALIRRKVRAVDKDALLHIKIPMPLPLSWGRTVQPYVPPELRAEAPGSEGNENRDGNAKEPPSTCLEVDDLPACDWSKLRKDYQGVLINPGWEVPGAHGADATARLSKLPLPRLCPVGFVFVWVAKEHITAVVKQLSRWGFVYIENLTWVLLHRDNSILRLPSPYSQRSHLTLFLFRKDGQGKDIELRHQRNPDVLFDCIRSSPGQAFDVPEEAYVSIETLLPTGKGKFLELWARTGSARQGWTRVCEQPKARKKPSAASLR